MSVNDQVTAENELTPKQETLITALLTPLSIVSAAKCAGVAEKTARRWLKFPHFQAAYKAAQRALFDQALTGLMQKVDKAITTLDRNMSATDSDIPVPASVQVRAAQIVLEQAINVHKMSELEQKLAALEEAVKEIKA